MNELNYFLNWTWREKGACADGCTNCFLLLCIITENYYYNHLTTPSLFLSSFIWYHFILSQRKKSTDRHWNEMVFIINIIISYPQVHNQVNLTRLLEGRPTRQDDISEQHFLDDDHDDDGGGDVFPEFTLSTFSFFHLLPAQRIVAFWMMVKLMVCLLIIFLLCVKVFIFIRAPKPSHLPAEIVEKLSSCVICGLWMQWWWSWWRRKLEGEENIIMGA